MKNWQKAFSTGGKALLTPTMDTAHGSRTPQTTHIGACSALTMVRLLENPESTPALNTRHYDRLLVFIASTSNKHPDIIKNMVWGLRS